MFYFMDCSSSSTHAQNVLPIVTSLYSCLRQLQKTYPDNRYCMERSSSCEVNGHVISKLSSATDAELSLPCSHKLSSGSQSTLFQFCLCSLNSFLSNICHVCNSICPYTKKLVCLKITFATFSNNIYSSSYAIQDVCRSHWTRGLGH
jgi:hypothetical protein